MPDESSRVLYRCMTECLADGLPEFDAGERPGLKARVPIDIKPDKEGQVLPNKGGLSISPDHPKNLPPPYRPDSLEGGYAEEPLYSTEVGTLPQGLAFRPAPKNPDKHGYIEPKNGMMLEAYQSALYSTRPSWKKRNDF